MITTEGCKTARASVKRFNNRKLGFSVQLFGKAFFGKTHRAYIVKVTNTETEETTPYCFLYIGGSNIRPFNVERCFRLWKKDEHCYDWLQPDCIQFD